MRGFFHSVPTGFVIMFCLISLAGMPFSLM